MSSERLQLRHEDYIRATERFKALRAFHQFLRGAHKTFLAGEPDTTPDLTSLYAGIREIEDAMREESEREGASRLQELSDLLNRMMAALREADRKMSPSLVRRYFERFRPQDEKTACQLLRFYFSQKDSDADVLDKVSFLATVAAAGSSDPSSSGARPRSELRRLFDLVTSGGVWARPSDHEASAVAYVVNEYAGKIARAATFDQLTNRGLIDELRALKRKIGASLIHPEVLTAVACANLTTREAFSRLYRGEEKLLDEAAGRIEELGRALKRGTGEEVVPEELRQFREARDQFRKLARDSNVRAKDVERLKAAIGQVLQKFDLKVYAANEETGFSVAPEDPGAEGDDALFWGPLVAQIREAVDAGSAKELDLEAWELDAVSRAGAAEEEPKNARDRMLLRAVALRRKAEQETEMLRAGGEGPRSLETVAHARASIARSPALDAGITEIIAAVHQANLVEQVHAWTRTRFRLLRAIADLWLTQDELRPDRHSQ